MLFCPNCSNIFDITKTVPKAVQFGGGDETPTEVSSSTQSEEPFDYITVFNKIQNNINLSQMEISKIVFDDAVSHPVFKKLQNKQKELIYNKLIEFKPIETKNNTKIIASNAYYICKNCCNVEQIKPGTAIIRRISEETQQGFEDIEK